MDLLEQPMPKNSQGVCKDSSDFDRAVTSQEHRAQAVQK